MRVIGLALVIALSIALSVIITPLAAGPQQAPKIPKIGLITSSTPAAIAHLVEAFRQGLRELGYVEGKTVSLELRYGENNPDQLPQLARELVRLKIDVIVASTDVVIAAVKRETRTLPIVMAFSTDPVGTGLVASLAHPGGNVTGLSNISAELSAKRLQLLREVVPRLSRIAYLWDPDIRGLVLDYKETEAAPHSMHLKLQSVEVSTATDLDHAMSAVASENAQALVVPPANPVAAANRAQIASLARRNRLPSIYGAREYVDAGGLMSYGPSTPAMFRRAALYVDKILKGAKPGDLPIEQPTKFELVINLKTAKVLGLTIPQTLLLRADQVIR